MRRVRKQRNNEMRGEKLEKEERGKHTVGVSVTKLTAAE